jgi:hypothetical protein
MNAGDLPLAKIFWSIFAVEAILVVVMLAKAFSSFGDYKGANGGMVGAWLVLIPIVVLVVVAALFLVAKAPWIRITCIVLLLLPVLSPIVGAPVQLVVRSVGDRIRSAQEERYRRGEHLFKEEGPRALAAAIADLDVARIKAALPGAGDLNRQVPTNLPYFVPMGDSATFLSFALERADESDRFAEVLRVLLEAGANPNVPRGKPLSTAIALSTRALKQLLAAGADVNAENGVGSLVWWNVLDGAHGSTDVSRLQILLDHGADTRFRTASGQGPIEPAVEGARWNAVLLLAKHIPNVKDMVLGQHITGREGETVHALLAREIQSLKDSGQPIPEPMRAALAFFDAQ